VFKLPLTKRHKLNKRKKVKTINHSQLIQKIAAIAGTVFCGLQTFTDAKAKGYPHGTIFKTVRSIGTIGANYQLAVEREANRQNVQTDFVAASLPWGQWLLPNKIISHKGSFYLRTQFTPNQRRTCEARILNYRDESGKFLSHDEVKPYLPAKRESAKQQTQGLTETIQVRTYKFDSIQKIRLQGQTYLVTQ
jgi:hypothetical protein